MRTKRPSRGTSAYRPGNLSRRGRKGCDFGWRSGWKKEGRSPLTESKYRKGAGEESALFRLTRGTREAGLRLWRSGISKAGRGRARLRRFFLKGQKRPKPFGTTSRRASFEGGRGTRKAGRRLWRSGISKAGRGRARLRRFFLFMKGRLGRLCRSRGRREPH